METFLTKSASNLITTKLTDKGLQKLHECNFKLTKWKVGDGQINYGITNPSNSIISKPFGNKLISELTKDFIDIKKFESFGDGEFRDRYIQEVKYINDYLVGGVALSDMVGTNILKMHRLPNTQINISEGDIIYFNWSRLFSEDPNKTYHLFYKVVKASGTMFHLDRELPDLRGYDGSIGVFNLTKSYPANKCNLIVDYNIDEQITERNIYEYGYNDDSSSYIYFSEFNGEIESVEIALPTIMDYRTNGDVILRNDGDNLMFNNDVVGKVHYDMGMVEINDKELIYAMSLTSSRNWTLPPLEIVGENEGEKVMHLTYFVENRIAGRVEHCAHIISVPCGDKYSVKFKVDDRLKTWMTDYNEGSVGWSASDFVVMMQITGKDEKPVYDKWMERSFKEMIVGDGGGETINPFNFVNSYFVIDSEANNKWIKHKLSNSYAGKELFMGEEEKLFGSVAINSHQNYYGGRTMLLITPSIKMESQNSTYNGGEKYISEFGLYDDEDDMLLYGKLSIPLKVPQDNSMAYLEVKISF